MFFFSQYPELPKAVPLKNVCTCKYCVAGTLGFSCYSAIRGNNTALIHELFLCFDKDWLGHGFIQCLFFRFILWSSEDIRKFLNEKEIDTSAPFRHQQCDLKTLISAEERPFFREMQAPTFY